MRMAVHVRQRVAKRQHRTLRRPHDVQQFVVVVHVVPWMRVEVAGRPRARHVGGIQFVRVGPAPLRHQRLSATEIRQTNIIDACWIFGFIVGWAMMGESNLARDGFFFVCNPHHDGRNLREDYFYVDKFEIDLCFFWRVIQNRHNFIWWRASHLHTPLICINSSWTLSSFNHVHNISRKFRWPKSQSSGDRGHEWFFFWFYI